MMVLQIFKPEIRSAIIDEREANQLAERFLIIRIRQPQNLHHRPFSVKTLPLAVGDHGEKEVKPHGFMAQTVKIAPMEKLPIDDAVLFGLSHGGYPTHIRRYH
jgi:hypothetical protein